MHPEKALHTENDSDDNTPSSIEVLLAQSSNDLPTSRENVPSPSNLQRDLASLSLSAIKPTTTIFELSNDEYEVHHH